MKESQLFKYRGKMVSFEIIKDMGETVKIRSLDLLHEATITRRKWDAQKNILANVESEASQPDKANAQAKLDGYARRRLSVSYKPKSA